MAIVTDLLAPDVRPPFDRRPPAEPHAPFSPPARYLHLRPRRLESDAGELPLSLRSWRELVGSINRMGGHRTLSPCDGKFYSDPLVVAPFVEVLRECDASPGEVGPEGRGFVAELAPGTGSHCPVRAADAILERERHGLMFVDYLRLALRWGGFPGFEAYRGKRPKEIAALTKGLLLF